MKQRLNGQRGRVLAQHPVIAAFKAESAQLPALNITSPVRCRRHVPELGQWLKHDTNAFIPWDTPPTHKRALFQRVIWDLIFPGQIYGVLRKLGYKW